MKTKIILLSAALSGILAANAYNLKATLGEDEEGAMAYLVNYDTGNKIDSVMVDEGVAVFNGTIGTPVPARLVVDGKRYSQFILEDADIALNPSARTVEGGMLNALDARISAQAQALASQYRAAADDAAKEAILAQYTAYTDSIMYANINNPIGYMIFMDKAYEMEPAQLQAFVDANPSLKQYARVNKLLQANMRKAATQPGAMFSDFEIEYNGAKHRLSDVVGKGDYVLVDFWASWCGPCIRQTAVLKDLYKEYADKGLKVLGVAVWDEPQNTLAAIEKHQLPWESWLNGGNIPTDVYGISGIPCIILFGPDGKILSRDKQDDALRADVAAAMANKK